MTAATQALGLLSTAEAAAQLGVSPATVRAWVRRKHLVVAMLTRDGSRATAWYLSTDVWACARARMSTAQVAAVADVWAEVDRLLAESAGQVQL